MTCVDITVLEEVFGGDGDTCFGAFNILFVRELLRLPPIDGRHVFEQVRSKANLFQLYDSTRRLNETITYNELTIIERQKNDRQYCDLLDEIR